MREWSLTQLTKGTGECSYHAHSYYDIAVFDPTSRWVAAHRMSFADRHITPEDRIEIGIVDIATRRWQTVGQSRAWSWQQGPMAQWCTNGPGQLFWNDRDAGQFITRIWDSRSGNVRTLDRATYAVDPGGRFTLGVNMARLDTLRPGYGYAGGDGARLDDPAPAEDGVWRQSVETNRADLILSVARARDFVMTTIERSGEKALSRFLREQKSLLFWFNHVKLSPSGARFTVKLRFRTRRGGWSDEQGVSLTCNVDGTDLRLLASATSHVIWYDEQQLFLWQRDGFYFFTDDAPQGHRSTAIAPEVVRKNAHIRFLPGRDNEFVCDTPYAESIDLFVYRESDKGIEKLGCFEHHRPARGAFRCDLHPNPSPDGRHVVVTSFQDGGRQIYLLSADEPSSVGKTHVG